MIFYCDGLIEVFSDSEKSNLRSNVPSKEDNTMKEENRTRDLMCPVKRERLLHVLSIEAVIEINPRAEIA